jgi:hypothetical protein
LNNTDQNRAAFKGVEEVVAPLDGVPIRNSGKYSWVA